MLDCVRRYLSGAVDDDLGRRPISRHIQLGDWEAISCHSYLLSDIAEVIETTSLSNCECHVNRAGLTRTADIRLVAGRSTPCWPNLVRCPVIRKTGYTACGICGPCLGYSLY